jgi:hypothetical protein
MDYNQFNPLEFVGHAIVVELCDGERVSGTCVPAEMEGYICLRSKDGSPFLINERYIIMMHLQPGESNDD